MVLSLNQVFVSISYVIMSKSSTASKSTSERSPNLISPIAVDSEASALILSELFVFTIVDRLESALDLVFISVLNEVVNEASTLIL